MVAWKPPIEIQTSRLMVPVSVTAENKPVLAVEPNKPVQCLAELKGEGAIQFRWQIPGYHPADNEKAVLNWKAPERQGLLTAYVLAYNDQGGVGIGRGTFAVAANTLFAAPRCKPARACGTRGSSTPKSRFPDDEGSGRGGDRSELTTRPSIPRVNERH